MTRPTPFRHAPGTVLGYRRDGRPIHVIAGAAEGDTPPAESPPAAEPPKPGPPQPTDWQAEAERLRVENEKNDALRQKHEKRAKENAQKAKDYDDLQRQHQTDSERAVADARAEGEQTAADKYRSKLARQALARAAATEQRSIPAAAVERMNLADLVDDDGEVDEAALTALVAGFAPLEQAPPEPDPRRRVVAGQGPRSSTKDRGGSVSAGRELYAERHQKKT